MVIHLMNDPEGLNPVNSVGSNATNIHNLLFDHLIALDFKTLMLEPRLAAAMPEVSPDKLIYTFTLRKGVQFSDGKPLTAEDVLFSFKAVMNPFVDSAPRRAELQNFVDCKVIDAQTVRFYLKESGPFNLNRLATYFFVLPQHIYDPEKYADAYTAREATLAFQNPGYVQEDVQVALRQFAEAFEDEKFQREKGFVIGTGRYAFDGWATGQSIRLVRNDNYWNKGGSAPSARQNLDTILYKTIPDVQTALQALKSGEIDFSDSFDPDQMADKMSGEDFEQNFSKKSVPYPYYEYVGWNQSIRRKGKQQLFADPRVRLAMAHLIDVKEIIANVLNGTAEPITSMVYHQRPEFNHDLSLIPYDETKALALLRQAGWADSDNDGILDQTIAGVHTNFSFSLYYKRGNELRRRIARNIQDKCKKVGIEVDVIDLEWTIMLDRLKQHDLDAWLGAWVYDSDEQDLFSLFHSSQSLNEGYNWASYSNPAADSVMEQIVREWDQEKRYTLHREIQRILHEDQPYTLLFANSARIAYNKRLTTDDWFGQRPCYDPPQFYVVNEQN